MAESPAPQTLSATVHDCAPLPPAPHVEASDEALVAAALDGDPAAFQALVERWWRPVYRTVWRLIGQREDAEDVTQESFLRAYAALSHFDPQYRFGGWITRIATNLSLNFRRKRARESFVGSSIDDADAFFENVPDDGDDTPPETQAADNDLGARLWAAVDALPEDYRTVLVLRHVVELSYDEIAAELELPMGTVKSRLARARRMVGEAMASAR